MEREKKEKGEDGKGMEGGGKGGLRNVLGEGKEA